MVIQLIDSFWNSLPFQIKWKLSQIFFFLNRTHIVFLKKLFDIFWQPHSCRAIDVKINPAVHFEAKSKEASFDLKSEIRWNQLARPC